MTWCKATNQLTVLCTFKNHVKPGWRVRKLSPAPDIRNIPVPCVEHWGNLRNLWQCSLMHMHLTNKYSTSWPEKPFGRLPTASNRKALLACSCIFRFVLKELLRAPLQLQRLYCMSDTNGISKLSRQTWKNCSHGPCWYKDSFAMTHCQEPFLDSSSARWPPLKTDTPYL